MRQRALRITALVFVLLLLVIAGGAYWIVATPGGAQLVIGRVARMLGEGTTIEGVEGRLGGRLRIRLIEIDRPELYLRVDDVDMDTSPPLRGRLVIHRLHARSVEMRSYSAGAAASVPASFKPPYPVKLEDGQVGTFRIGAISKEEREAKDPATKRALREAARAKDLVLRDIIVKGEGDDREWRIAQASVATEYGAARISGTLGNASPFPVDLVGTFAGRLQERDLNVAARIKGALASLEAHLDADIGGTRATAQAVLTPFSSPPLKSLDVNARDVNLANIAANLPTTRIAVSARLVPQGPGFAGPVRIENAEPGPWDKQRFPFNVASGRVVAAAGRVDVTELAVSLLGGGTANGSATWQDGAIKADLQLDNVDLAALHGELQKTQVGGRLGITGHRGSQRFDVALKDPRFEIEGRATLANERVEVEAARIRTGGGSVSGKGGLALEGGREFRFEGRAEHFDPSAFVKTAKGDLNFAFVVAGNMAHGLAGEAKLDIAPSTYAGLPAAGRINVAGDARRLASADVDVMLGGASLNAKGSFGRVGDALDLAFRAPNLSVVGKPFGLQLAGRMEGSARLTGTFASPAGRVSVTGENLTLPSSIHVRHLMVRGEAGVAPDSVVDATVQAKGIARGPQSPPSQLAEAATATLKGTRLAHRFELDAQVSRDTHIKAALQGGQDARARPLTWNGRLETFAFTGRGAFALTAPAALTLSAARVELGDASLKGDWGEARLAVTRWTPRSIDLKGSTPGLQVQNVIRSFRLGNIPRSSLVIAADWDLHAADTFDGTLDVRRVSGDLRVGEPPLPLGLREATLHVESVRGRARGSVDIAGERIGRVHGEGTGAIARGADGGWGLAQSAPVDGRLTAELPDIASLAGWLGPDSKLGGRVEANVTVSGTGADPRVAGRARATNLVVREPQSGFEIEEGDVALTMAGRGGAPQCGFLLVVGDGALTRAGRSIAIERFTAKTPWRPPEAARERMRRVDMVDAGTITAEGSIDLASRSGAIVVKADHAVVTQLPTRFVALSGEARLAAGSDGLTVTGAFKADAGWIGALDTPLPSPSEDIVVIRASQPAASAIEAPGKEPMRVDLRFSLGDRVWFQGRGLDTRLAGDLQISGEVGKSLRAQGTIRTVSGTYEGYGQKLTIERGVLVFSGPLDNPQLNVLALRKGLPVEAGVEILGTTTRPRIRLVSSPDVPEPEKLSWLVLGRGAADSAPGDAGVLMAAAQALLGNNNPGSDLTRKLGFDEIKIGRSDTNSVLGVLPQSTVAGRTGTPSAAEVVTVGKRLNNRLHLSYEQGLADAEGALTVTWLISRRFQVLVRAGYLPGLDAVYRWTFP